MPGSAAGAAPVSEEHSAGARAPSGSSSPATADGSLLDDARWLRARYVEEQLTLRQVGLLAGVSEKSVLKAMRAHAIPTRKRGGVPGRVVATGLITDANWLQEQVRKGLGLAEVARLAGVSESTVRRALGRAGIRPTPARRRSAPPGLLGDRQWVHQQYVEQQLTLDQIAALAGVGRTTVHKALRHHGIAARRPTTEHLPDNTVHPELHQPDWLHEQHTVLGRSGAEIARMLGCTRGTVYRALQRLSTQQDDGRPAAGG